MRSCILEDNFCKTLKRSLSYSRLFPFDCIWFLWRENCPNGHSSNLQFTIWSNNNGHNAHPLGDVSTTRKQQQKQLPNLLLPLPINVPSHETHSSKEKWFLTMFSFLHHLSAFLRRKSLHQTVSRTAIIRGYTRNLVLESS